VYDVSTYFPSARGLFVSMIGFGFLLARRVFFQNSSGPAARRPGGEKLREHKLLRESAY